MSGASRTPIAWQHRDMNFFQNSYGGRQSAVDRHSLSQNGASVSTSDRRSSSRSGTGTNGGGASSANRYHHQSRNGGRSGTGVGHSMHPSSGTTDTTPTSLSSDSATETETTVNEGRMSAANTNGRIYYTPLPPHLQQPSQDGTLRSSASMGMPIYHVPGPGSATLDGAPCPVHHHEAMMAAAAMGGGSLVGTLGRDQGMGPMAGGQPIYGPGPGDPNGGLYMPLSIASFPRRAASVYDVRMGPQSIQPYGTLPLPGMGGGPMGPPSLIGIGPHGPFSLPPPHHPGMMTFASRSSLGRTRASRKRQAASMMLLPLLMPGPHPHQHPPPQHHGPHGPPRRPLSPIPPHLLPPMMRPRPVVVATTNEGQPLAPEPLPMRDPEKGGMKSPTPVPPPMSKNGHHGMMSSAASKQGSLESKKNKIQCCKGPLLVMWIILGIIGFGILLATVLSVTIG